MSRRSSIPFRRSSGPHRRSPAPLARRGSAEARLQRPPAEHQTDASAAAPLAPGNIRPITCRPMTAGCSIGSPAAATPLPPGCGPQAAYQHCNSFFAQRLPASDVDGWASPQGGLLLPVQSAGHPGDWVPNLHATQSADCSMPAPAQLQLQLPYLLPSYCSAPASMYDTYSQPGSGRRRCGSSQLIRSEDQPSGGCFTVCTRSNPECSAMSTTPSAAGAVPARSFSLSMPFGHPVALLQHYSPERAVPSHFGGWHQVPSAFAFADEATGGAHCSDVHGGSGGSSSRHSGSAGPESEGWASAYRLAAGYDLQLRPPSTVSQVNGGHPVGLYPLAWHGIALLPVEQQLYAGGMLTLSKRRLASHA
jgi:hypothetical protein